MSLPEFELVSFLMCPYVRRSRIVLIEKDIEHKVNYLNPQDLPAWFHDISPLGKVPVLLVNGEPLFESMVIVEYLDEATPGSLYPADIFEKAKTRSWIVFGEDILSQSFDMMNTLDEKEYKKAVALLDERFDILEEDVLAEGPFFNGEGFGIIDAVYAPVFHFHKAIREIDDQGLFDDRPRLSAWSDRLLAHPSVIASVPDGFEDKLTNWIRGKESILSAKMTTG